MRIHETAKECLEIILDLQTYLEHVRVIDLLLDPACPRADISTILKELRDQGCLEIDADGNLFPLTPGAEMVGQTSVRCHILTHFLMELGVSEETAMADARKLEPQLSEETFEKIRQSMLSNTISHSTPAKE